MSFYKIRCILQSWLINPGMTVPYTWDNWETSKLRCVWSLYGSREEPSTISIAIGEVSAIDINSNSIREVKE